MQIFQCMIKHILFIVLLSFLFSCGTGLRISKSDFKPIENDFSTSFVNQSFKTSKSIAGSTTGPKLLELFGVSESEAERVTLTFKDDSLELVYTDKSVVKTLSFQVKHTRKGYLEILSVNKKIQIPPFLPFLYSNVDFNRTRIGFTTRGELVIDDKWEKSGNVFIFMGGAGGRTQYFFKPLNNY
ncbi:hypothetical protein SAMN05660841_03059 [Sphingobacterium nematocida]|uniref:Uncharacterized protein n=2 Tax=Sphingobacterium nematocida TaxID=1513896 RepID=A0A1T5F5X2_9SPHI|nr:hypothetical protein SAMN05660841_03059 [Sphingobacterium nematocida]